MTKYQFLLFPSSTPNGWRFMSTIWSILRKANGKCHWLFALVKAPSGTPPAARTACLQL